MSAFELRVSLPVNPTTWEAESAEEWYGNFKKETETSFLSALKVHINPGSGSLPSHLNAVSRLLILHGLMSISWDMKRRDQTSLGNFRLCNPLIIIAKANEIQGLSALTLTNDKPGSLSLMMRGKQILTLIV